MQQLLPEILYFLVNKDIEFLLYRGGKEGQPQQFLVRVLISSFSCPSHFGIFVLRLLCVLMFPFLADITISFKSGHGRALNMDGRIAMITSCWHGNRKTWRPNNMETEQHWNWTTWKLNSIETEQHGNRTTWRWNNMETPSDGNVKNGNFRNFKIDRFPQIFLTVSSKFWYVSAF